MIKTEHDRLRELRKKLALSQIQMAESIGITQGYYSDMERGKVGISANTLRSIVDIYNEVSLDWLVFGRGSMFVQTDSESILRDPVTPYTSGNFLVPAAAQAGYLGDWSQEWMDQNLKPINLPGLTKGIFRTFEVMGESMMPTIREGDYVVGRRLSAPTDIRANRVHIVVSGTQGIYIKRVVVYDDLLILESDNQEFRPITMQGEDLREIYYAERRITAFILRATTERYQAATHGAISGASL